LREEARKEGLSHKRAARLIDPSSLILRSDPTVFTPTKSAPLRSTSSSDWVADFTSLKKLLRSLDSYRSTSPNLPQPQAPYDPPNVQLIAKNGDERETLGLCRLAIAVSVQATPGNEVVIAKIQTLSTQDQEVLMLALGPVSSQLLYGFFLVLSSSRTLGCSGDHSISPRTARTQRPQTLPLPP
jgi:hypothetical protein